MWKIASSKNNKNKKRYAKCQENMTNAGELHRQPEWTIDQTLRSSDKAK